MSWHHHVYLSRSRYGGGSPSSYGRYQGNPESGYNSNASEDSYGTPMGRIGSAARFCHDCGTKYPIATAKFCCECGVRRMNVYWCARLVTLDIMYTVIVFYVQIKKLLFISWPIHQFLFRKIAKSFLSYKEEKHSMMLKVGQSHLQIPA